MIKRKSLLWAVVTAVTLTLASSVMAFAASDNATYSFEKDVQGWAGADANPTYTTGKSTVAVDTAQVFQGGSSLKITLAGDDKNYYANMPKDEIKAGKTYTFNVFIPGNVDLSAIQTYYQNKSWANWVTGTYLAAADVKKDQWFTMTLEVPADVEMPLDAVGIQIALNSAKAGEVYVDSVSDGSEPAATEAADTTAATTDTAATDTAATTDTPAATTDTANPKTGDVGVIPYMVLAATSGAALLKRKSNK